MTDMQLSPEKAEQVKLWLASLEMERTSNAWRTKPTRQADPRVITQVVTKKVYPTRREREARDKMLFNAGRFAAGARDKAAVTAQLQLDKEMENEL